MSRWGWCDYVVGIVRCASTDSIMAQTDVQPQSVSSSPKLRSLTGKSEEPIASVRDRTPW